MSAIAVICEYNPFHYGHQKQLEDIRALRSNDCTVISIMSGNYVQRGTVAICNKYLRAEAAISCGADLVLELPYPWSCSCAEHFARAGVQIAGGLGAVDSLCFGAEDFTSTEQLNLYAERLKSEEFTEEFEKARAEHSLSDIICREQVFEMLYGDNLPTKPNDILALEYARAVNDIASDIELLPIKRTGSWSATEARKLYLNSDAKLETLIPPKAYDLYHRSAPADSRILYNALMAKLRLCDESLFENIADGGGGLCAHIIKCAQSAGTPEEFIRLCSTKRYTDARIRRTMVYMLFGTAESDLKEIPLFTVVLGANDKGRKFLRSSMKSGRRSIEIITKPADYTDIIKNQLEKTQLSDSVYALCCGKASGEYIKQHPYMI